MSDGFVAPEAESAPGLKGFFYTTAAAKAIIERLQADPTSGIANGTVAIRLAIALALANLGSKPLKPRLPDRDGITLGIGQFDGDGAVDKLVRHLYFDGKDSSKFDVYTTAELLAEAGLEIIADGLAEGLTVTQLITQQ